MEVGDFYDQYYLLSLIKHSIILDGITPVIKGVDNNNGTLIELSIDLFMKTFT